MQTQFSLAQLAYADIREADRILRDCVHCGMCLAVCPTYTILVDERDSPRGRIYLIKNMLESEKPDRETALHLDRCLTCLACEAVCPSKVDYRHLLDIGRAHLRPEDRPLFKRLKRFVLTHVISRAALLRQVRRLVRIFPFVPKMIPLLRPFKRRHRRLDTGPSRFSTPTARVMLLLGCAQQVLRPEINQAAIDLLTALDIDVVSSGDACCGTLAHHGGYQKTARRQAASLLEKALDAKVDAVLSTTSGCIAGMMEYHRWFNEPYPEIMDVAAYLRRYTDRLKKIDIKCQFAYHVPCSLRHGVSGPDHVRDLLIQTGYHLTDMPEAHLCCGAAGLYHVMEPEIARTLKERKLVAVANMKPDGIVSSNVGCLEQFGQVPGYHYVELLNWARKGKAPKCVGLPHIS